MSNELLHQLPPDVLDFFARKGAELGPGIAQTGSSVGVKVRRILQMVSELAGKPLEQLSVLDLACGEGVYAIETALRGGTVLGVDARTERMNNGVRIADRLGLGNVRFEQNDVRQVTVDSHGEFDVVYLFGILYHLDHQDAFRVLENVHAMAREWLFIDTHITLAPHDELSHNGHVYRGRRVREHPDDASQEARRANLLASIDNTFSFIFDRPSLVRLLVDTGFTTVVECHAPLEADKRADRITLAAGKSAPVIVSTYPWVNQKNEDEIERFLKAAIAPSTTSAQRWGVGANVKGLMKRALRRFGYEIRRVRPAGADRPSLGRRCAERPSDENARAT